MTYEIEVKKAGGRESLIDQLAAAMLVAGDRIGPGTYVVRVQSRAKLEKRAERSRASDSIGQVYVTRAAADRYAQARSLQHEEARRELTALLMDARPSSSQPADGLEGWLSRTLKFDVTAHVSREGRLAVVTHVHVRDLASL